MDTATQLPALQSKPRPWQRNFFARGAPHQRLWFRLRCVPALDFQGALRFSVVDADAAAVKGAFTGDRSTVSNEVSCLSGGTVTLLTCSADRPRFSNDCLPIGVALSPASS
jgi:hypothetical protein